METVGVMPLYAGVRLGSAALQVLADDAGVEMIQIKGPSVDPSLLDVSWVVDPVTGTSVEQSVPRVSVDVDLLVRPSHVGRLFETMRAHRWVMAYRFQDGSAFEHASTWLREGLSSADVHRSFPGIGLDPEAAFERLWADRTQKTIGGYPCVVPSLAAQRLILILHATRGGDLGGADLRNAWGRATPEQRAEVDALAADLRATVALAAGTGRLERHRGSREYPLWKALSTGNASRLVLWAARVRAQPSPARAVRMAFWLVAPKAGRLARTLGREPTAAELGRAWAEQVALAASELGRGLRRLVGAVRRRARG